MALILACPERIKVRYLPEVERRRFKAKRIDHAGPTLLFLLLCSSFVPALLTEFDAARVLRLIEAAIVALAQPNHSFVSGEQRRGDLPSELACSSGGWQVADSAAIVCDGRLVSPAISTGSAGRRPPGLRKRRLRSARSPRAPPSPPSSSPLPERG